jgi:nicotinamidase-related amidase
MEKLEVHAVQTALVAIDLQRGIVGREWAPYVSADVVRRTVEIANALRARGGTVVWVRVDLAQLLTLPADAPNTAAAVATPLHASALVDELGVQADDVVITKRQWGAFYGTELDQQLRRRGIRSLIMAGIATNYGVESTARCAFDRGYEQVFAEDAMTSVNKQAHDFPLQYVFPRMGRIRTTAQILAALNGGA